MTTSLAEATNNLLSGSPLSWEKFEDHKAGVITLKTPAARRVFKFLLKQNSSRVAEANESLFDSLIAEWKDETSDPASAVEQAGAVVASGSWRLHRLEALHFGGLTTLHGPVFDVWFDGENWCLEGQNGSGKTSLVSAILWALTGKRIQEQHGVIDDSGNRYPVFNSKGPQVGEWPPLASYPSTVQELKTDVEVWVRLTFRDEKGETATAYRKGLSHAVGDPEPFEDLLNTLTGGGGKPMKLINEVHHKFDGTIGVAQAVDVQKFWTQTLQGQIQTAFHVYADFEAHLGEPRLFAWEKNVLTLPISQNAEIKKITLFQTGVAAAAKTGGRAGDGELSIEEWKTATPLKLPNHEVYQLAAGTLDPVAGIGDLLIVSNYAKVTRRDLVVIAFGNRLLARRYNETDVHPTLAVLTGQAVDPYALPQPIIVPREGVEPRKVVGTIFTSNLLPPPPKNENNEIVALSDPAILAKSLKNARLFQVKGRSAEPIALEGQFLITHRVPFGEDALAQLDGRLVIAVDEHGSRYFKRLRRHASMVVLESLNPDGTTPAELLSLDGAQMLPKLTGLLNVSGVLFELP